jgi:hypothetical protein
MRLVQEDSCNPVVRVATREDVIFIAANLRNADVNELQTASFGMDPLETLFNGFYLSDPCLAGTAPDGNPAVLFGAVPTGRWGRVWLVATSAVEQWPITFLRHSRTWVHFLTLMYPVLYNIVDARNTLHLSWLRWAGFALSSTTFRVNNYPFHFLMKGGTSDV